MRLDVSISGRHPLPAEGAIYFCISEALTNAAKHAHGPVEVAVSDGDGALSFTVTDTGPGFDPVAAEGGAGLDNMTDRIGALGGTVTVDSRPGHPTTVSGTLPILAAVP